MKKKISVLLVDDHQMFRDSLIDFLANEYVCKEVRGAATVAEARTLIEAAAPDVAICDINFPGEEGGYDLINWIRNNYPDVGILCLTMHSELQVLREVAKLEVRGFVTKSSGYDQLFQAVRSVATGGYYLDQVLLEKVMKDMGRSQGAPRRETDRVSTKGAAAALAELTAREQEIFWLFAEGATQHTIAEQLYLSPKTVENHRSNIYRKLNVHDRLSLLSFAREHGLNSNTRQ
jgi:two-component system, NarL family, response regulator DegU